MTVTLDCNVVELLPQLLARRGTETPDRLFVTEIGGGNSTYGEIDIRARTWAAAFRRAGVRSGDFVASMQGPGAEELATWVGLAWIGAVQVPLNLDYVGRMLAHAFDLTEARVAIIEPTYLERLRDAAASLPRLELVVLLSAEEPPNGDPFRVLSRDGFLAGLEPAEDVVGPEPWQPALTLFTSGTTGPSKAVLIPWAQMRKWSMYQFPLPLMDDSDVWYGPWPTFHITGKYAPYMMAILGGRMAVRPRLSASDFVSDLTTHGITATILALGLVPLLTAAASEAGSSSPGGPASLRHVVMVPVIPDFEAFEQRWGARISTSYAMTEIGAAMMRWPGEIDEATRASVGRPVPGLEARVVDEHDLEVPHGVVGELIVRSDEPWTLNGGYVGMPEATARAWRNGWFHTGDAFRRDADGNFYFVDRMKDCIRRRGENISSFDVEAQVNDHPEVMESAAIPVPAGRDGEDVKVVVVKKAGASLTEADLHAFLAAKLPRFMVPRYIEFVDELPKTPTQKVRKVELRQAALTAATWDREAMVSGPSLAAGPGPGGLIKRR